MICSFHNLGEGFVNTVTIIVLRKEISDKDKETLQRLFPGKHLDFLVTNPSNYMDHDRQCRELNADLVVLPERPIPSLAMERGVSHVTITPEGQVLELLPLKPEFKPFVPK